MDRNQPSALRRSADTKRAGQNAHVSSGRSRVVRNVFGAVLGLLALAVGACSSSAGAGVCSCPPPPNEAIIELGCVPVEPPVVKTMGPCSACPTVLANGSVPEGSNCAVLPNSNRILLTTNSAGICHVEVTFGNGATSSVDVDFVSEWRACGSDPKGCGQAFIPVTPDGGFDTLSLPDPTCDAGVHAAASN
jgi:hypothetical protein